MERANVLGAAEDAGTMSILQSSGRDGVDADALPEPEQRGPGGPGVGGTPPLPPHE